MAEAGQGVTPVAAADGEVARALREERDRLQSELDAERSKGFWSRLFGGTSATEDSERARERMRGRIAIALIFTLIVVVVATFGYLVMLSTNFGELTTDDLITVIQSVGTTLLTPLVGLIGAVTGFYYGGQTAVQAASQTAQATHDASQTAARTAAQTAAQTASNTAAQMQEGDLMYTVKQGDTLFKIARRYNTTVDALVEANNITDPDHIAPGDELRIPRGSTLPT